MAIVVAVVVSACQNPNRSGVDKLNEKSYAFHYRNLDSTRYYAEQSLRLADSLGVDGAESYNHLAFVSIAKMQYKQAEEQLKEVTRKTNNQVELLIADVQMMRLCQRQSKNRDFYNFRERAAGRMARIEGEADHLSPHQKKRLVYAQSEYCIVSSTYFYYVGLTKEALRSLEEIDPNGSIQQDVAQELNYWYNYGSGGVLTDGSAEEIAQQEFAYLMRCYLAAQEQHYPFWEAQAMQSMSEHLQKPAMRNFLIRENLPAMKYLNVDQMPDSLLAGNLALRSSNLFRAYGDVYQIAGGYRTLAECYWQIKDYHSALVCLQRALNDNKAINQAPDLVASIREQLSLVYSAVDDKASSDLNRNIYLDMQEQTRQDRQLEARAEQLGAASRQLNIMLAAVIIMIVVVVALLFLFAIMRRRSDARFSLDTLLEPLTQWRKKNEAQTLANRERTEELQEETSLVKLHLSKNKRRNVEQRAKIQLVSHIMPFIDRMVNEVKQLQTRGESNDVRQRRYQYIAELTDSINDYNTVLTQWIQMRQGEVSLKIESFALQDLFDIVVRGSMNYRMKGITLDVVPTTSVVKADKTLTLFMINTMADNARKFTPEGGKVKVSAREAPDFVEISIEDNGCGMDQETLSHIFDRTYTGGHGFGLKNCYGIIEKYKKISRIFNVCTLQAESEVGEGSRLFFRLPKGVVRLVVMLLMTVVGAWTAPAVAAQLFDAQTTERQPSKPANPLNLRRDTTSRASHFADSAYYANIAGRYTDALRYADSCHKYLAAKDTAILLDISNEAAVAALALHRWDVYEKNNKIYTRLFREVSADSSLPEYVSRMQNSKTNKNVAVALLLLLLAIIFPAYYFLYYRHRLNYQFCIDRINAMNRLLLQDIPDEEKLKGISRLDNFDRYSISAQQQEGLRVIVQQIKDALQHSIDAASLQETSFELAEDNLRRLRMDNYQLHVSNSVLDNCLSTLKHETMYYPSRIRQLVDEGDKDLEGMAELVGYYKEIYRILLLQAVRQVLPVRMDIETTRYLFELLTKLNSGEKPTIEAKNRGDRYVEVEVDMARYTITEKECNELFTAHTKDLNFLICRQIVREMGEQTNMRACGIRAIRTEDGHARVVIMMPERWLLPEIDNRRGDASPSDNKEIKPTTR